MVMMTVTISGTLIGHVRSLYKMALEYLALGQGVRQGINGYTHHALPAYIITVAAVEAFINEAFLSNWARIIFKDSSLWTISKESLDRMEIGLKLIIIPQLLFARSLSRDSQPYQDMALLIRIRNDFVHYKLKGKPPRYLQSLDKRGISLVATAKNSKIDYSWPDKLSSSEGIRWAHNTACSVVQELIGFAPADKAKGGPIELACNFYHIPDSYAKDWLIKKGIDPESSNP